MSSLRYVLEIKTSIIHDSSKHADELMCLFNVDSDYSEIEGTFF